MKKDHAFKTTCIYIYILTVCFVLNRYNAQKQQKQLLKQQQQQQKSQQQQQLQNQSNNIVPIHPIHPPAMDNLQNIYTTGHIVLNGSLLDGGPVFPTGNDSAQHGEPPMMYSQEIISHQQHVSHISSSSQQHHVDFVDSNVMHSRQRGGSKKDRVPVVHRGDPGAHYSSSSSHNYERHMMKKSSLKSSLPDLSNNNRGEHNNSDTQSVKSSMSSSNKHYRHQYSRGMSENHLPIPPDLVQIFPPTQRGSSYKNTYHHPQLPVIGAVGGGGDGGGGGGSGSRSGGGRSGSGYSSDSGSKRHGVNQGGSSSSQHHHHHGGHRSGSSRKHKSSSSGYTSDSAGLHRSSRQRGGSGYSSDSGPQRGRRYHRSEHGTAHGIDPAVDDKMVPISRPPGGKPKLGAHTSSASGFPGYTSADDYFSDNSRGARQQHNNNQQMQPWQPHNEVAIDDFQEDCDNNHKHGGCGNNHGPNSDCERCSTCSSSSDSEFDYYLEKSKNQLYERQKIAYVDPYRGIRSAQHSPDDSPVRRKPGGKHRKKSSKSKQDKQCVIS